MDRWAAAHQGRTCFSGEETPPLHTWGGTALFLHQWQSDNSSAWSPSSGSMGVAGSTLASFPTSKIWERRLITEVVVRDFALKILRWPSIPLPFHERRLPILSCSERRVDWLVDKRNFDGGRFFLDKRGSYQFWSIINTSWYIGGWLAVRSTAITASWPRTIGAAITTAYINL